MFSGNTSQSDLLNSTNSSGLLTTLHLQPAAQALLMAVFLILFSTSVLGNSLVLVVALSAGKRIIATAVYLVGLGTLNIVISLQLLVGFVNVAGRWVVVGGTLCQLSALILIAFKANYLLVFCSVCDLVAKMMKPAQFNNKASRNASTIIVSITLLGVVLYTIINMSLHMVTPPFYLILPEHRPFSICNEWTALSTAGEVSSITRLLSVDLSWGVSLALTLSATAACCAAMVKVLLLRRRRRQIRSRLKTGIIGISKIEDFQVNLKRQMRIGWALGSVMVSQLVLSALYHSLRLPVGYRGGGAFALDLAGMLSLHLLVHTGLVLIMISRVFRERIKAILKCSQLETSQHKIAITFKTQKGYKTGSDSDNNNSRCKGLKGLKAKRIHPLQTVLAMPVSV